MTGRRTLASLILHSKDGEWGKSDPFDGSTRMAVIRGTDFEAVRTGDFSSVPRRYISANHGLVKTLRDRDIVIETAGGSPGRPTGRTIFMRPGLLAPLEVPATCASFARFLRIDESLAAPEYVFWFLQSAYSSGQLNAFHTQHTGVARFQWTTCANGVEVPLPSLTTQHKVSAALSAYDDLIENNNRRIKLLEEMAQRIYREWFVDFRYPGHGKAPLLDSEFGLIPHNWKWRTLGALAEDVRVGADPRAVDPHTPYIGLEHLPEHSIAIQDWGVATDAASSKLSYELGDVLFGKIRPYFHKVGPPPVAGICSTDAMVIRARANQFAGLVLGVVSSDAFVQEAVQTSQGTKMPRANWKVLEKFPVAVPTDELLCKFNLLMESTVGTIHRLVMATRNLRAARDLLLPRLISGEIDVEDLDIQLPEAA